MPTWVDMISSAQCFAECGKLSLICSKSGTERLWTTLDIRAGSCSHEQNAALCMLGLQSRLHPTSPSRVGSAVLDYCFFLNLHGRMRSWSLVGFGRLPAPPPPVPPRLKHLGSESVCTVITQKYLTPDLIFLLQVYLDVPCLT